MRIFIPTSNNYVQACEWTCKLLAKYWPSHPPVDVVHFELCPQVILPRFHLYDGGMQYGCPKWTLQFSRYLIQSTEEFILLMLDDYGLFQPVNEEAIARSVFLLQNSTNICGVALTWQPTRKEPMPEYDGQFVTFPRWDWTINTQAGLWRRSDLLAICQGAADLCGASPWQTEQAWSHWFHCNLWDKGYRIAGWNCPEPSNPSGFVDSVDKRGWPVAYNNLFHTGKRDSRHDAFLRSEGLL